MVLLRPSSPRLLPSNLSASRRRGWYLSFVGWCAEGLWARSADFRMRSLSLLLS